MRFSDLRYLYDPPMNCTCDDTCSIRRDQVTEIDLSPTMSVCEKFAHQEPGRSGGIGIRGGFKIR